MPINWVAEPWGTRFAFFCDHCNHEIVMPDGEKASPVGNGVAGILERQGDAGRGIMVFLHKGKCDESYAYRVESWHEVATWLVFLGNNYHVDWEAARDSAAALAADEV